jgi:hypothetical protein
LQHNLQLKQLHRDSHRPCQPGTILVQKDEVVYVNHTPGVQRLRILIKGRRIFV